MSHVDGPLLLSVASTTSEVVGGVERGVVGRGTEVDVVGGVVTTAVLDFVVGGKKVLPPPPPELFELPLEHAVASASTSPTTRAQRPVRRVIGPRPSLVDHMGYVIWDLLTIP